MSRWAYYMTRECVRGLGELERAAAADKRRQEREAEALYVANREEEAQDLSFGIQQRCAWVDKMLATGCSITESEVLTLLFPEFVPKSFVQSRHLSKVPKKPALSDFNSRVDCPSWFLGLFQGRVKRSARKERYSDELASAYFEYKRSLIEYGSLIAEREAKLDKAERDHDLAVAELKAHHVKQGVEFEQMMKQGQHDSPVVLAGLVQVALNHDPWNSADCFSWLPTVSSSPCGKKIFIEVELPDPDVVPAAERYRYIKKYDKMREVDRSLASTRQIYKTIVVSMLLCSSFRAYLIGDCLPESVTCSGWRYGVNPATGNHERFCVASVETNRGDWQKKFLDDCDPIVLFKDLGGRIRARVEGYSPVIEHEPQGSSRVGIQHMPWSGALDVREWIELRLKSAVIGTT